MPAHAASVSGSINVSVTVLPGCTISTSPLAFGGYVPLTSASAQSSMTLNCSAGAAYAVSLDEGTQGDGSTRRMTRADGATLPYDIYRDSAHLQRWGAGSTALAGTGSGRDTTVPLYAAIRPNPAQAGNYTDHVVVLITY